MTQCSTMQFPRLVYSNDPSLDLFSSDWNLDVIAYHGSLVLPFITAWFITAHLCHGRFDGEPLAGMAVAFNTWRLKNLLTPAEEHCDLAAP